MKNLSPRKTQAWMLAAALLASAPALHAALTDIADAPPVATGSGIKPNVMFMLDDSSSMAHDYMPDKVGGASNQCRGGGNCDNGTNGDLSGTTTSGPPYFAAQYNTLFYNPATRHSPPVDFDGSNTTYKSYDGSAGYLWTAVKVNPVPFPGSGGTTNLTTSFPEEVWCDNASPVGGVTSTIHCRRNGLTSPTFSVSITRPGAGTTAIVTLANHNCSVNDNVTIVNATQAAYNGTFTITATTATTFSYTVAGSPATPATGTPAASPCNIPIVKLLSSGTTTTAVFPIAHGCALGEKITIKGSATPGQNVSLSGNPANFTVASVPDNRTLTYTTTANNGAAVQEGVDASSGTFVARLGGDPTSVPKKPVCALSTSSYSTSVTVPPLMQGFPQGIFTNLLTRNGPPHFYTITANEYCTNEALTTCKAPVSETIGATPTAYTFPAPVRGCSAVGDVNASPAATANCGRNFIAFSRARYGYFNRTDIVPGPTYPKAVTRTDCAGATTCTYNEEMTNFANWYAYYRTRVQMAKSAVGIAFKNLGLGYRVGYNGLNNLATSGFKFLPVAPFDSAPGGQKSKWYTLLYSVTGAGSGYSDPGGGGATPLRETLSRIGRYYAGMKTAAAPYMTDDPIQYSCQQNFYVFTTDGYWNTTPGPIKLDGTAMRDQDGAAKGVPRPFMDAFNSAAGDGLGTLADAAYYYYNTDLRTSTNNPIGALGTDVTLNNVPSVPKDPATWQHMTTFSMGFGVDGNLIYAPNYETPGNSADYDAVAGLVSPTKDWPAPTSGGITTADDLWHAAVNGRGTYFSVKDPASAVSGLLGAFEGIAQRVGTVAAPATSNPNVVPGDNFLFTSTFITLDWNSDIKRKTIDPSTGAISSTVDWSAQAQLDAKTGASSDTRTIFTFDGSTGNKLKSFLWANLTPTEQGYFNGTSGGRNFLSQWVALSGTQQNQCDTGSGTTCGEKLVNFLRGQRGFETPDSTNSMVTPNTGNNSLFRHRVHILGDIVNAEAVYVRQPVVNYFDQGYSAFKTAQASRQGTVYAAANDGMLHALDASTGAERWAYIPSMVMPNMGKLAHFDYKVNHLYFVDGTPTTGDICTSNCSTASATWATILVGGLNAGGRGFYALDITNPASPKALWELKSSATCIPSSNNVPADPVAANTFSDCDIGLSFGNPIITKRSDGKWVVLVTSGYNNVSPGTGGGFLYVLDAVTGAILTKTATLIPSPPTPQINAGNTTTPSGFAKINAFAAHTDNDNSTLRVYGGDLNGNLWRIDGGSGAPNTLATSGNKATLLAILGGASGTQGNGTQPITTKPELGEILVSGVGTFEMVFVGSGRYLGTSDPSNLSQQSFYGIKDPLGVFSGHGVVRTSPNMVQQTVTEVPPVAPSTVPERHVTANTVNYVSKIGWFIDFNPGNVSPGERSNTDPSLDLGILSFTTNAPNSNSCDVGGKSYIYFLDYTTGGPLPANLASGLGGLFLDNSLASRVVVIRVGNQVIGITVVGSQPDTPKETPLGPAASPASGKRINWREFNF